MVVVENQLTTQNPMYQDEIKLSTLMPNKLHVVAVISNPCNFQTRWRLAKEFITRMNRNKQLILYVVEMIYPKFNKDFMVTNKYNPKHLQLKTTTPIWHKENMVNIGIAKLLPKDWKYVAWIDADIEFENSHWVSDTLSKLSSTNDIVQLFSHAIDMDKNRNAMQIFQGSIYQYISHMKRGDGLNYWHPGYGWACTKEVYNKMGKIFELGILGSADDHMLKSWIGEQSWITSVHSKCDKDYKDAVEEFANNTCDFKLGYINGVIKHNYHGTKANRKYKERWEILVNHNFSPKNHLTVDKDGILIPSDTCPIGLLEDIMLYFKERNEDD